MLHVNKMHTLFKLQQKQQHEVTGYLQMRTDEVRLSIIGTIIKHHYVSYTGTV